VIKKLISSWFATRGVIPNSQLWEKIGNLDISQLWEFWEFDEISHWDWEFYKFLISKFIHAKSVSGVYPNIKILSFRER
jgi:hypothetical protein